MTPGGAPARSPRRPRLGRGVVATLVLVAAAGAGWWLSQGEGGDSPSPEPVPIADPGPAPAVPPAPVDETPPSEPEPPPVAGTVEGFVPGTILPDGSLELVHGERPWIALATLPESEDLRLSVRIPVPVDSATELSTLVSIDGRYVFLGDIAVEAPALDTVPVGLSRAELEPGVYLVQVKTHEGGAIPLRRFRFELR